MEKKYTCEVYLYSTFGPKFIVALEVADVSDCICFLEEEEMEWDEIEVRNIEYSKFYRQNLSYFINKIINPKSEKVLLAYVK